MRTTTLGRRSRPVHGRHHAAGRRPSPARSGRVAAIPDVRTLGRELAAETRTAGFFFRHEDPPPSRILRTRSEAGMRVGELWDHMLERDGFLSGLWEKRWKAVLGLPRYVLPRDETPRAKEIADVCRGILSDVPRLHTNLVHQMEAIIRGWSAEEILWRPIERGPLAGLWGLDLIDRPMWRFLYRDGELHVRRANGQHVKAPDGKFLVMKTGSKDNPWGGLGLLHYSYWYWFATHRAFKYYLIFLEKFAQPTTVGRYARTLDENLDNENVGRLLEAIELLQTEYGIVVPDDLVIDFLEAKRGGEVTYEKFLEIGNRAKALLFLGEVDTSGLSKDPGSYARNRVSNEVRLETIRIDAHELDAHMTDHLLRLIVEVNYGPDEPVPVWYTEIDDAEDLAMRQERADAVLDRGLPLPRDYYYRINKAPVPREGEPVLHFPARGGADPVDQDEQEETLPFTRRERAALARYRAGDLDAYRLAA